MIRCGRCGRVAPQDKKAGDSCLTWKHLGQNNEHLCPGIYALERKDGLGVASIIPEREPMDTAQAFKQILSELQEVRKDLNSIIKNSAPQYPDDHPIHSRNA